MKIKKFNESNYNDNEADMIIAITRDFESAYDNKFCFINLDIDWKKFSEEYHLYKKYYVYRDKVMELQYSHINSQDVLQTIDYLNNFKNDLEQTLNILNVKFKK